MSKQSVTSEIINACEIKHARRGLEARLFYYYVSYITLPAIRHVYMHTLTLPTDNLVCAGCCSTLNHIVTYLFKKLSKNKGGPLSPSSQTAFMRILDLHPEILQQMLYSMMNVIMFENCRNQWSMSRPLLGLILLNEEVCVCVFC